ncbi:MAG: ankyrin repeat domain-containing protein [Sandaracinaceae bacterium]
MERPSKLPEVLEKITRAGLEARLEERNETPLIWAVSEGYHDLAVTLIEAGAELDARNVDGNTPLIRAACEGRTELASVLLKVGADVDAQNEDGYSALILAKRRGHLEIVDLLLAAGADRTLVTDFGTTYDDPGHSPKISLTGRRDAGLEARIADAITRCRDGRAAGRTLEKRVNLEAGDRFVPTSVLRAAYVRYANTTAPTQPSHVSLEDGLELGIVSSAVPEIARADLLAALPLARGRARRSGRALSPLRCARAARDHLAARRRAHLGRHRPLLCSRTVGDRSEILATILVGRSKDTIFFTGRYKQQPAPRDDPRDRRLRAAEPRRPEPALVRPLPLPEITRFKPRGYHHIANFVVSKEQRGKKLSRHLLDAIVEHYARDHLVARGRAVGHSQHLLAGGLLADRRSAVAAADGAARLLPALSGAESFFVEHPWAPAACPRRGWQRASTTSPTTRRRASPNATRRRSPRATSASTCSTASRRCFARGRSTREAPLPGDVRLPMTLTRKRYEHTVETQKVALHRRGRYHGSTREEDARQAGGPAAPGGRGDGAHDDHRVPGRRVARDRDLEARFPNVYVVERRLPVPTQEVRTDGTVFCWCPLEEAIPEAGPLTRRVLEAMKELVVGDKRFVYVDSKIQYFER